MSELNIELKRAYLLMEWGRLDEALEASGRAAEAFPGRALPHSLAGSFLSAFGRHRDALGPLKIALRLEPDDPFTRLCLAEANLFLGRFKHARRALDGLNVASESQSEWSRQLVSWLDGGHRPDSLVVSPTSTC